MTRDEAESTLIHTIRTILSEHPSLAGCASMAISAGVEDAMEKKQEALANTQLAMSLALALLPPNRKSEATVRHLEQMVLKAIPAPDHRNLAEDKFVQRMEAAL